MTSKKQPANKTQALSADPLFLQAEHLAKDFSLFPAHNKQSLSEEVKGLLTEDAIQSNLKSMSIKLSNRPWIKTAQARSE